MNLKFTKDYTGRETAMQAYRQGDKADIPNEQALELIRLGVAVELWASIGKQYDPPKAEGGPLPEGTIIGGREGVEVILPDAHILPFKEEKPARPKKPRKGKSKT